MKMKMIMRDIQNFLHYNSKMCIAVMGLYVAIISDILYNSKNHLHNPQTGSQLTPIRFEQITHQIQ